MSNAFTDLMVARKIEKLKAELGGTYAAREPGGLVDERVYASPFSRPRRPLVRSVIEPFAAGHGWTNFNGTLATVTDDTTDHALGTQSLKVITKTDNSAGSVQKTTGYNVNLTGKQIMLWVKVEGGTANLTELLLYAASDSGFVNNYSWTIGDTGGVEQQVWREGQWTPIVLGFADAAATGAPNRAAITAFRLRARALNGTALTLHYGGIGTVEESGTFPTGVISFGCDDSYASQYNVMRATLDKYGWAATCYVIVELLGQAGSMTMDQLKDLEQAHGWEIAGHSFTLDMHTKGYGSGATLAEIEADIRKLRKWLLDNKFRGADHMAYPKGYYTIDSTAIIGKYFSTGRTVINRLSETIRPSDRMRLRSLSFSNNTTLATAKAFVDKIKAGKGWGNITIHDLVTTPTTGVHWAIADFQALVDYIAVSGVPVMPVGEVLARDRADDATMTAPDGSRWVLSVGNDGSLTTTKL